MYHMTTQMYSKQTAEWLGKTVAESMVVSAANSQVKVELATEQAECRQRRNCI